VLSSSRLSSGGIDGGARGDNGDLGFPALSAVLYNAPPVEGCDESVGGGLGELHGDVCGEVWVERPWIDGAKLLYAGSGVAEWCDPAGEFACGGGNMCAEGSMMLAAGAGSLVGLISRGASSDGAGSLAGWISPGAASLAVALSLSISRSIEILCERRETFSRLMALITSAIVGRVDTSTLAHC
jgi:hypothetical protein